MKIFVRLTKLHDIVGRAKYFASKKEHGDMICNSPQKDWKPYQDFERVNRKSFKANNEGLEIIVALPNEWEKSSYLYYRCQCIAEIFAEKKD